MPKRSSQSGVSLAEYGLILACVVCVCLAGLQSLGSRVSGNMDAIAKKVSTIKVDPDLDPYPDFSVTGSLNTSSTSSGSPAPSPTLSVRQPGESQRNKAP